jgi:hypothetical protein
LEIVKARDHLGDLGVDEKVMLKWIKIDFGRCGLNLTVQDRVQWQDFVVTALNHRVL